MTKRTRTILGDILRISQWHRMRGDLSLLDKLQLQTLKGAFWRLRMVCDEVALMETR